MRQLDLARLSLLVVASFIGACKGQEPTGSEALVFNGTAAKAEDQQSIVKLNRLEADGAGTAATKKFCTGVLISKKEVLTAAHCVADMKTGGLQIDKADGKGTISIAVRGVNLDQAWPKVGGTANGAEYLSRHDLAIVRFADELSDKPVTYKIAKPGAGLHDEVTMFGYGSTDSLFSGKSSNTGKLMHASNYISASNDGTLHISAYLDKDKANGKGVILPGDSGGPLFNKQGELIGIASSVVVVSTDLSGVPYQVDARFIDLTGPIASQLLASSTSIRATAQISADAATETEYFLCGGDDGSQDDTAVNNRAQNAASQQATAQQVAAQQAAQQAQQREVYPGQAQQPGRAYAGQQQVVAANYGNQAATNQTSAAPLNLMAVIKALFGIQ